jgi:predicted anti-sigma-YlaC factor YlaD
MNTRLTERFDVLRAAIGLFVVLGVVLTAVAGYALLAPASFAISADLAVSLLSGVSLLAFAVVLTMWLHNQMGRRRPRRSA